MPDELRDKIAGQIQNVLSKHDMDLKDTDFLLTLNPLGISNKCYDIADWIIANRPENLFDNDYRRREKHGVFDEALDQFLSNLANSPKNEQENKQ
jgi:hypothetical protein